jgi:hypothetical protein
MKATRTSTRPLDRKGDRRGARGEPNAWTLTNTGKQVHDSIAGLDNQRALGAALSEASG